MQEPFRKFRFLGDRLAKRSRLLRDYLGEELVRQGKLHQEGRLYGLFQTFRDQVFHELTPAEFADAFAQMLAYGLSLARLNSSKHTITLNNAREYLARSGIVWQDDGQRTDLHIRKHFIKDRQRVELSVVEQ